MANSRSLAEADGATPNGSLVPMDGAFHLLAIGINTYEHWPRLENAVKGASEIAALLQSDYGFTQVRTLQEAEATRAAIIGELARLVDLLGPDDSLVIYFAGHGHIDRRTQAGAWIPVDAKREEKGRYDASATWLQNSVVRDHLKSCNARHILIISDSCFAGDFLRGVREAPALIDDAYVLESYRQRSRQALTAGGLHPVFDSGLHGHSVYTGFLLNALRMHDEPWLLPQQIHAKVCRGVAANAPQKPAFGVLHDTGGEVGGEFVFFRRGFGSVEAAVAENQRRLVEMERLREAAQESHREFAAKIQALKQADAEVAERIAQLQSAQGHTLGGSSLDELVSLIGQREEDAKELARLEEKARCDEARRKEELAEVERQDRQRRREHFEANLAKYRRIRDSATADPEIRESAWRELCRLCGIDPIPAEPIELVWDEGLHCPIAKPPATPVVPGSKRWALGAVLVLTAFLARMLMPIQTTEAIEGGRTDPEGPTNSGQATGTKLESAERAESGKAGAQTEWWERPFENSLGMKFVPVVVGTKESRKVAFCIWPTRVKDYEAYAAAQRGVDGSWRDPVFEGSPVTSGPEHPVVNVSWDDSKKFCEWLTEKERRGGRMGSAELYRLPTDEEWSWAVGIGEAEEKAGARSPVEGRWRIRAGTHPWAYPWGKDWPPPKGAGNYHQSLKLDDYEVRSPVGSFVANPQGLHDLGANVFEWCEDYWIGVGGNRVLRGAASTVSDPLYLLSSSRWDLEPGFRTQVCGFRVVLVSRSSW
jgi:hypothetical protein